MSPVNWEAWRHEREREEFERRPKLDPRLYRDQLPEDIRQDLDNPNRPPGEEPGEEYRLAAVIYAASETAKRVEMARVPHEDSSALPFREVFNGDDDIRDRDQEAVASRVGKQRNHDGHFTRKRRLRLAEEHRRREEAAQAAFREWADPLVREVGHEPGQVSPDGQDWQAWNAYAKAVEACIWRVIRGEIATAQEKSRQGDGLGRDGVDEQRIALVPADGNGKDVKALASLWEVSEKTARETANRLAEDGRLRFEEVPSSRGGKKKRLFWAAEDTL